MLEVETRDLYHVSISQYPLALVFSNCWHAVFNSISYRFDWKSI